MKKTGQKIMSKLTDYDPEIHHLAQAVRDTRFEVENWMRDHLNSLIFDGDDSPGESLLQNHMTALVQLLTAADAPSFTCSTNGEEHLLFKNPYWHALAYTFIDRKNSLPPFPDELAAPYANQ